MDDWQLAPLNNIALIIVIVLVVVGIIILLVVLFNSSKSTPPNNNSSDSSNQDDDNNAASGSGGAPPNPKSTKGSKTTLGSVSKSTPKATGDSTLTPVLPQQGNVQAPPQLPLPSSHIAVPVETVPPATPPVVGVSASVALTVVDSVTVAPTVVDSASVALTTGVVPTGTSQQIIPPSAFDSSSDDPSISAGNASGLPITTSSDIVIDGAKGSSESTIQNTEGDQPSAASESSDLLISSSNSKDLSVQLSSESEQLDIEQLARDEVLASVEEISLPSPLESSDSNSLTVEIPRLPVAPRTKLYIPVMTDLSARATKSASTSSEEINFSNANETVGLSVDQSIGDPASFSSDFSSQTDKSARPNQRKTRVNPLSELVNLGRDKKNNPRMGPFQ